MILTISQPEQIAKFIKSETPKEWGQVMNSKELAKHQAELGYIFKSKKVKKLFSKLTHVRSLAYNYLTDKIELDGVNDFKMKAFLPLGANASTPLMFCVSDWENYLMRCQDLDEEELLLEKKAELLAEYSEEQISMRATNLLNSQLDQLLGELKDAELKQRDKKFKALNKDFEALGMAERI